MNKTTKDQTISRFFDRESKRMSDRQKSSGLPISAMKHVNYLVESNPKSVLDVGCGPGTLLMEVKNKSPKTKVIGIDLSTSMINEASENFKEMGISEGVDLKVVNFKNFNDAESVDGVSMHRVLCCYPDRETLMNKCVSLNAEEIVVTLPRPWLFLRVLLKLFSPIAALTNSFRPYLHRIDDLTNQMKSKGYEWETIDQSRFWMTLAFKRSSSSKSLNE